MKGCRPLTNKEIKDVVAALRDGSKYERRNVCLFVLGLSTGFRVSELLSLRARDVWRENKPAREIYLRKCNSKGKVAGRSVAINRKARQAIAEYLSASDVPADGPLFPSRKGTKAISRVQAHRILSTGFDRAGVAGGKVATHSLRKTYAAKLRDRGCDLRDLQAALGHSSPLATEKYLAPNDSKIRAASRSLSW